MSYSDETLIAALVTSPTQKQAAEMVGCDKSTLTRRMSDADFADRVKIAKRDYLRTYLSGAVSRQELAIDALIDILKNNPNDAVRLRAADIILKNI